MHTQTTYLNNTYKTKETVTLKNGSETLTIAVNELIYVINRDNHFLLFMENELIAIKGQFKTLLLQLPGYFVEINKHTIVNLNYLEYIQPEERKVIIKNSGYHKISGEYLEFLCSTFKINKQNSTFF